MGQHRGSLLRVSNHAESQSTPKVVHSLDVYGGSIPANAANLPSMASPCGSTSCPPISASARTTRVTTSPTSQTQRHTAATGRTAHASQTRKPHPHSQSACTSKRTCPTSPPPQRNEQNTTSSLPHNTKHPQHPRLPKRRGQCTTHSPTSAATPSACH